ncbi:MAG: hypothetical protein ACJAT4_003109 [Granulosicoccus sp.]|jgi:uncharacterized protein (DUF2237 family)
MKNALLMISLISIFLMYSFFSANPINNDSMNVATKEAKNVLGETLQACCFEPRTGWFRDGYCNTDLNDQGSHVVCAIMTDDFLNFSASCGNNLKTPAPAYGFPGLKAGDKWCLCVSRWKDGMEAGVAPPIVLASTHQNALEVVSLDDLKKHEKK